MKRFALFLLLVPACAGKGQPTPDRSDATEAAQETDRWTTSSAIVQGNIRVTVTSSAVESVPNGAAMAEAFVVRLSIENTHPSRRSEYDSWVPNAELRDNFGNPYKTLVRRGTGTRDAPLDPGKPIVDVLMFEAPIATASHLNLTLPGRNVGTSPGYNFKIALQTSGARLDTVRQAAAAHEAEANARVAAIRAQEAEAKRKVDAERSAAERRAAERAAAEAREQRELEERKVEAEKKKAEAAVEAEKLRQESDKQRREAEFAAMPGKLAASKQGLEVAQGKLAKIKAARSRYPFSGAVPPADHFDSTGKYLYYTVEQKAARTTELQKEVDRLTGTIAALEAGIKAGKP